MSSMFSVLLVIVMNIVPSSVDSFTMEMPAGDTIRFDRQKDGGWQATELPDDKMGVYYVSGSQIGMMIAGNRKVVDLSSAIKVSDWKTTDNVDLGGASVSIKRTDNGLDFVMKEEGGKPEGNSFKIRWKAAEKKDPFSELDRDIVKGLSDDKWNELSTEMTAAFWVQYKKAHEESVGRSYDHYVGLYSPADGKGAAVTVTKSDSGRMFVEMEGSTLPAVTTGGAVVFTTGDVVISPLLPVLEDTKPYCSLELLTIVRSEEDYYLKAYGMPSETGMKLLKQD